MEGSEGAVVQFLVLTFRIRKRPESGVETPYAILNCGFRFLGNQSIVVSVFLTPSGVIIVPLVSTFPIVPARLCS